MLHIMSGAVSVPDPSIHAGLCDGDFAVSSHARPGWLCVELGLSSEGMGS